MRRRTPEDLTGVSDLIDEHEDREAVMRTMVRARKTVPDHDPVNGVWPHDRATAYAASAIKGGLWQGKRQKGAGTEGARQLVPIFKSALAPIQDHSLHADRLITDAIGPHRGTACIVVTEDMPKGDADWTLDDRLEKGIVAYTDDAVFFGMVRAYGISPQKGDKAYGTVIAAWRDDDHVHLQAVAVAGGILGVRSAVLDIDGSLDEAAVENRAARHTRNIDAFRNMASNMVSAALLEARKRQGIEETVAEAPIDPLIGSIPDMHVWNDGVVRVSGVNLPTPSETWDQASGRIAAEPRDIEAVESLRLATAGNSVIASLVDRLKPMLEGSVKQVDRRLKAVAPYDVVAAKRAIDTKEVDALLSTMRCNAATMVSELRAVGNEAEALETERLAKEATGRNGYGAVVALAASTAFGNLEGIHSAATRILSAASLSPRTLSTGPVEIDPDGDERRSISCTVPRFGAHTVRWEDLHEAAAAAMDDGMTATAALPLIVLHHTDVDGSSAMVLQLVDGQPSMGVWRRLEAVVDKEEDDLSWCLRRVVQTSISTLQPVLEARDPTDGASASKPNDEDDQRKSAPIIDPTTDEAGMTKDDVGDAVTDAATPSSDESDRKPFLGTIGASSLAKERQVAAKHSPIESRSFKLKAERQWLKPFASIKVSVRKRDHATAVIDRWFQQERTRLGRAVMMDQASLEKGWRLEWEHGPDDRIRAVSATIADFGTPVIEIVEESHGGEVLQSYGTNLLHVLSEEVGASSPDGPVLTGLQTIGDPEQLKAFVDLAVDPRRVLNLMLFSVDGEGRTMEVADRAKSEETIARYADDCLGLMHVRLIEPAMMRALDRIWNSEIVPHEGCVRMYRPGFDPEHDTKFQHPLCLKNPQGKEMLQTILNKSIKSSVSRNAASSSSVVAEALRMAIDSRTDDIGQHDQETVNEPDLFMATEIATGEQDPEADLASVVEDLRDDFMSGMSSSAFAGMFDDPEEYKVDSQDYSGEAAPPKPARQARKPKEDIGEIVRMALEPVLDRLDRIERMIEDRLR
jgi:hypothetical protein